MKQDSITRKSWIVGLFIITLCIPGLKAEQDSLVWLEWLSPGLESVQAPAFSSMKNLEGKEFQAEEIFTYQADIQENRPYEGMHYPFNGKGERQWKKLKASRDGYVTVGPFMDGQGYIYGRAASYIYTPVYTTLRLVVTSASHLRVSHNHAQIATTTLKAGKESKIVKSLTLEPGKHLLMIEAVLDEQDTGPWKFQCHIKGDSLPGNLMLTADDRRYMDIDLLMNGTRIRSVLPSYDGRYLLSAYSKTEGPDGNRESWYEISERESGDMVYSLRGLSIRNLQWSPVYQQLAYIDPGKKADKVWVLEIPSGQQKQVAEIEDLSDYRWSPDGTFLICTIREEAKENKNGIRRYEHMADRQPWWRKRNFLHKLELSSGRLIRLTWGHLSTNLQDIRPDSRKVLFSMSQPDFNQRPYSVNTLCELDLGNVEVDTLWHGRYGFQAKYSPDGKKLLMSGSPMLFGKKGTTTPDSLIPNDYDTQLYLFDIEKSQARALSRDFKPTIDGFTWKSGDKIWIKAEEGTYKYLYHLDPGKMEYKRLNTTPDVIKRWAVSSTGNLITFTGSSVSYPTRSFVYDTETHTEKIMNDPEAEVFQRVSFGKVADWDFEHNGDRIKGRVYYPPDFDPQKKYPVIVYYYGGTNPTDRSFRGRYPKNLFAAYGYLVYVLQPSGATGFGQEYSARHVNNWGKSVADEIIEGTKAFLKAHPYADPDHVGCIGASYGGFMTMLLTTRTDIFSAAIAHAGISSISSYWGEGYWGYAYSSVASANSFPWNNKELYIEQSPLFHADKVNTPLLLLHGGSDTNVPPGESIQMFTALKLLGKTVEYIEIEGQNHHILDYEKRIMWQKSIMAWFGHWLKEEPAWWKDLYPDRNL